MAEWFKDQGYRTAGVSANAWVGPEFGLARGFEAFVRVWQVRKADSDVTRVLKGAQHLSDRQKAMRVLATRRPTDAMNLSFRYLRRRIRYGDFNAGGVNREAIRFVESDRSSPLFLFVNYMEAHAPYWGPRRHRRRFLPAGTTSLSARHIPQSSSKVNAGVATLSEGDLAVLRALYRAEVRYLDERLSQLVAAIDERRGLENAVVVILSDHGDNIGDHGLLGHNYSVWETLLHVPIVIRYPDGAGGGTRDPRLAQTVDVLPTVVQVAGGTVSGAIAGRSLSSASTRETATAEYLAPMPSLETLRRKYPGADLDRFDRSLRALRTADDEKLIWDSRASTSSTICEPIRARRRTWRFGDPSGSRSSRGCSAWIRNGPPTGSRTPSRWRMTCAGSSRRWGTCCELGRQGRGGPAAPSVSVRSLAVRADGTPCPGSGGRSSWRTSRPPGSSRPGSMW